jgi:LemA protein
MFHTTSIATSRARSTRRGAIGKGCLIAGGVGAVLLLGVLIIGGMASGKYNGLVQDKARVESSWAEIDNQYRRRYDLIPNLVATVKGAADFEKSTLEAVTEARASVGRAQLPKDIPTDPAQLQAYIQAQQNLSGALSRLMVVAESYPQLKSSQNFLSLQDQLEGTENRIGVARRDYIESVRRYNTSIRSFPANLIAGMFNFAPAAQFEATPDERATPKVDFGEKKK